MLKEKKKGRLENLAGGIAECQRGERTLNKPKICFKEILKMPSV